MVWNKPSKEEIKKKITESKKNKKRKKIYIFKKKIFDFKNLFLSWNGKFLVKKTIKKFQLFLFLFSFFLWFGTGFYIIKESEKGVVLRLGTFKKIVYPGLHWKLNFIDKIYKIDSSRLKKMFISKNFFTSDQNLVNIKLHLKYFLKNINNYLFYIDFPDKSLEEVTSSELRKLVSRYTGNQILKNVNLFFLKKLKKEINQVISIYHTGIKVTDLKIHSVSFPKELKKIFVESRNREINSKRYISLAEKNARKIIVVANKNAKKIIKNSIFNKKLEILKIKEEIKLFKKIFPYYQSEKNGVKKYFYTLALEKILKNLKEKSTSNRSNLDLILFLKKNLLFKKEKNNINNATDYNFSFFKKHFLLKKN